jgi:hypothetical protein
VTARLVSLWEPCLETARLPLISYRTCAVTRYAGSCRSFATIPTGSRTHPWLGACIPSGFELKTLTRTSLPGTGGDGTLEG